MMAKCACGNTASLGETQCGRCRAEERNRAEEADAATQRDRAAFVDGYRWLTELREAFAAGPVLTDEMVDQALGLYLAGASVGETVGILIGEV